MQTLVCADVDYNEVGHFLIDIENPQEYVDTIRPDKIELMNQLLREATQLDLPIKLTGEFYVMDWGWEF
jgi:hypothetical protein